MSNGELFIKENPTVEIKRNGSCVWIYFDGVNHYTMPVEWWDKEIDVLDKIRTEIESIYKEDMECDGCSDMGMVLDIIDKYRGEQT